MIWIKKIMAKTLERSLRESGFSQVCPSQGLIRAKELVPTDGKVETEQIAESEIKQTPFSKEDILEIGNRVMAVYQDKSRCDEEVYIAPGSLFGSDEKFVVYNRTYDRR